MNAMSRPDAPGSMRYSLTATVMPEGRISIMLRLYRDGDTTRTLLDVVELRDAAEVMLKCHQHLRRHGVDSMPESAEPPEMAGEGWRVSRPSEHLSLLARPA